MKKILSVLLLMVSMLSAQSRDSSIVFTSPEPDAIKPHHSTMDDAWGVDILLSNNGFGVAGFFRHEYTRYLSGTVTLGIAESKDDNEIEYYDYWGQSFVPGKINRFLMMPVLFGAQYRLFADDITDSFRPYVNAGAGPTIVFASPYDKEYFNSLGYARTYYTAGGFIGLGAYFGADTGSLSGINIRYYYVPFSGGIVSLQDANGRIGRKKDFGGFFITINLGSAF